MSSSVNVSPPPPSVVRDVLEWQHSRKYLYWRVKRRIAEQASPPPLFFWIKRWSRALTFPPPQGLRKHLSALPFEDQTAKLTTIMGRAYEDDKAFLAKLEADGPAVRNQVAMLKMAALSRSVAALLVGLSDKDKAAVLKDL